MHNLVHAAQPGAPLNAVDSSEQPAPWDDFGITKGPQLGSSGPSDAERSAFERHSDIPLADASAALDDNGSCINANDASRPNEQQAPASEHRKAAVMRAQGASASAQGPDAQVTAARAAAAEPDSASLAVRDNAAHAPRVQAREPSAPYADVAAMPFDAPPQVRSVGALPQAQAAHHARFSDHAHAGSRAAKRGEDGAAVASDAASEPPSTDAELVARVARVRQAAGSQLSAKVATGCTRTAADGSEDEVVERLPELRRAHSFAECEAQLAHGQLAEVRSYHKPLHDPCQCSPRDSIVFRRWRGMQCPCLQSEIRSLPEAVPRMHEFTIKLRAISGAGAVQTDAKRWPRERALRENIAVAVRCRPPPPNSLWAWDVSPEHHKISVNAKAASLPALKRVTSELTHHRRGAGKLAREGAHEFDLVFDDQASTRQVYKGAAQQIVLSACNGINGAVLAYGQVCTTNCNVHCALHATRRQCVCFHSSTVAG